VKRRPKHDYHQEYKSGDGTPLGFYPAAKLEEVASALGMSKQGVLYAERRALEKLRVALMARGITNSRL
jgi:hypothetical protein